MLEAFLTHCSSWADRIIVADQHSTDGSREIAMRFPKVTLVDNPTDEWVEWRCRARLLEEAAKVPGDKIVFALDADEFLSAGFAHTDGWRRIMESMPNEVFCFRWLNMYGDLRHGEVGEFQAEWAAHLGQDVDLQGEYVKREGNSVHCSRVPCLEESRCRYTTIDDVRFVHLGGLNRGRTRNKLDFYSVVNIDKNAKKANPIALYRAYAGQLAHTAPEMPSVVRLEAAGGDDVSPLLRTADRGQHYVDEMAAIMRREGCRKFRWLCIWDNTDLWASGISYRPPLHVRLVHYYLRRTQPCAGRPYIRLIDKLLKQIVG